jgi:hypothetical protein
MPKRKSPKVGSRAKVMHGNAHHTSGGLTKKSLRRNKRGRIVSRKKSASARKKNLLKDYKHMRFKSPRKRRSRRKSPRKRSRKACKYGKLKSPSKRRRCRKRRTCKSKGRLKHHIGARQCRKRKRRSKRKSPKKSKSRKSKRKSRK